jgi:hypothetical protein
MVGHAEDGLSPGVARCGGFWSFNSLDGGRAGSRLATVHAPLIREISNFDVFPRDSATTCER